MRRLPLPYALFAFSMSGTLLAGCQASMPSPPRAPVTGFVTDLPAFESFIASHPEPAEFHAAYPDVLLVLPGATATRELRMNHSRYFAELDGQGRIVGGKFQ